MLDKFSPRERKLILIVGSILPFFLLYFCYSWTVSTFNNLNDEINRLQSINERETTKQLVGMLAGERRAEYRKASLPVNIDEGFSKYINDWLYTVGEEIGLNLSHTPGQGAPRRIEDRIIFESRSGTIDTLATLDQTVQFLYRFDQKRALHRINSLTLTPVESDKPGRDQRIRLNIRYEVLGLPDAELINELPEGNWDRLRADLDSYQAIIVRRNIFGPPNNDPTIASFTPARAEVGKPINFAINANPNDPWEELEFELTKTSGIAKLERRDPKSNAVQFVSPGFNKAGRYEFEIKVTDNGFPPKSATRRFELVVEEPRRETPRRETPAPPVKNAPNTLITSLSQNVFGEKEVWFNFPIAGLPSRLKVGDSFELDDQQWIISEVDIDARTCTIENSGNLLTFKQGSRLSQPIKTIKQADVTTAATSEQSSKN
ncbi:MAG TPA: hypothetical protein PKD64_10945 [Pirellulaceae bacterium]|nr:hypothetical protein [Pirellulaceae bacterium]HMO92699.1 hypothetical protein [Pirellulaceae bacterium]HMP70380.1 hypothetical protein [Pirellulaceae bacterium]